jgi:hypothetical protein
MTQNLIFKIENSRTLRALFITGLFILLQQVSFAQSGLINPINYFASKPSTVEEKSYYANVSSEKAIQYYKSLGMIRYSAQEYDIRTIRFRNAKKNVFIMVFPMSKNRVYIVMSRMQFVDEIDA